MPNDSAGKEARRPALYLMEISAAENLSEAYCKKHFPKRTEKAQRFRFMEDRFRCLCAGALLHEVLGLEETDIRYGEYGKPFSDSGPFFSLSHSGKYAVLGVSSAPVGVDIEQAEEDYLDIMLQVFTGEEISYVGKDLKRFYTLWTLKESVTKGAGIGLNQELKDLSVLPLLRGEPVSCGARRWFGSSLLIDGGTYALSFASQIKENPEIVRLGSLFSGQ